MQSLPHHYVVSAAAQPAENVELSSPGLESLESAAPTEFGGPGDRWSPETLLVAAVADCFILTFKAIARASKLEWTALRCDAIGVLDRIDSVTQFSALELQVVLDVPADTNEEKAAKLLEKAEHACLITNSMKCETQLTTTVVAGGQ
jgi:peroxiredoxin-like protein